MPNVSPTADERREIARLYVREWRSLAEIGASLHWSPTAIRNALRREGVRLRSRGHRNWRHKALPQAEVRRTVELYQAGAEGGGPLSVEEVAERLGRSYEAVRNRLEQAGELRAPHVTLKQTVRMR